ncbi:sugar transferase [Agromyces sp. NPDC056379]|uniref:sugar transferase n=1 Tax=unclassified Agromyces TaxID=2639701 RepID=UPI0035E373D2
MTTVRTYDPVKRALDVIGAAVGLIVLSPVMLGVSIAVVVRFGRPILFTQERPGLGGRPFRLVKFRSMLDADPVRGLTSDADRRTPWGNAFRSTSLDELPELWNVLRGEMSFVGPRPLLPSYLDRYTRQQARRHEVRPGITGLAQVNGRNMLSWDDRLRLDVEYVDHRSFLFDIRILARTVLPVLRGAGVTGPGGAASEEFLGTAESAAE